MSVDFSFYTKEHFRIHSGAYLEGAEPAPPPPKLSKGIIHSQKNH